MITNVRFDGFIGIFDTLYNTQPLIDYWKYHDKIGSTFKRKGVYGKDRKPHMRKDTIIATEDFMVDHNAGYIFMKEYNAITDACLEQYVNEFEQLLLLNFQQIYLNVQRTLPSEGYHGWHAERGTIGSNRRVLATMMFLNDIDEGGETEFLYQSLRFKPKKGQFLLWPAGFTHVHRGNPPLSGEKYISTSWIENTNG